jgi:ferredoxin
MMGKKMDYHNRKVALFWYSQTGNSFSCAERAGNLLERSGYEVTVSYVLNPTGNPYDEDLFLFVFPTMQFYVPSAMKNFIENMPRQSTNKKALAIITCAGAPANVPAILKRMLSEKNIDLVNHLVIRSRNSWIFLNKIIPLPQKTIKPDEKSFIRVESFIQRNMMNGIRKKLTIFNPLSLFHWIGVYGESASENELKKLYGDRTFLKEKCIDCNYCVALCPSGAIIRGEEISYNDDLCIGCCGCMNVCPTNAWQCSKIGPEFFYKGMNVKTMAAATGRLQHTPT